MNSDYAEYDRHLVSFAHVLTQSVHFAASRFYERPVKVALIFSSRYLNPGTFFVYDQFGFLDNYQAELYHFFRTHSMKSAFAQSVNINQNVYSEIRGLLFYRVVTRDSCQVWCIELPSYMLPGLAAQWFVRKAADYFLRAPSTDLNEWRYIHRNIMGEEDNAVRFILNQLGWFARDVQSLDDVENLLTLIPKIAAKTEEQRKSQGAIVFCSSGAPKLLLAFKQPVHLSRTKHICKLLRSSSFNSVSLMVVGQHAVGLVERKNIPPNSFEIGFLGGRGILNFGGRPISYFNSERFYDVSADFRDEAKLESHLKPALAALVLKLARSARDRRYGCTLLLTNSTFDSPVEGQTLELPVPIGDLPNGLLDSICAIDGAVHIDVDSVCLKAYGCLLDGLAVEHEDRSRGARYNSAKRFSHLHQGAAALIVISEDGPVSIFLNGDEISPSEDFSIKYAPRNMNPPRLRDLFPGAMFD